KGASRSASEYTAADPIPISRSVRKMRIAISPRFATSTFVNMRRGLYEAERPQRLRYRGTLGGAGLRRDPDRVAHNGMLPCLRTGAATCLVRQASSAAISAGRVRRG